VRGFRNLPEGALTWSFIGTWELEDSGGTLTVDGQLHDPQKKLLEQWTGGGALSWDDPAINPTNNFVICGGSFNQSSSTLQLTVSASGGFNRSPASGAGFATLDGIYPLLTLAVDWKTMKIAAGSIDATGTLSNHGVSATLSWPAVTPTNLPGDQDGR
jgi:hypothetical protein